MSTKKVLFLVPYPTEGASARLRVEQFLPFLRDAGVQCTISPFYTTDFYRILYRRGHILQKMGMFIVASVRRLWDVARAPSYAVVFIHREVFPIGLPVIESLLIALRRVFRYRIIFDYDDAIYLPPQGSRTGMALLKCPWRTDFIIRHSDLVIAGNDFLRRHAASLNKNIEIIPTCIDTDACVKPLTYAERKGVVIGWIGSHTTRRYLEEVKDVFVKLLERYPDLRIHVVGGEPEGMHNDRIRFIPWNLETERQEIGQFDIGIMPMPDTDWTQGKCAFKMLFCMGMEIPVVVSAVGVNKDIITNGINGYLAGTVAEWEARLCQLIDSPKLRRALGLAGRKTVLDSFSLRAHAPRFVEIICAAISARPAL